MLQLNFIQKLNTTRIFRFKMDIEESKQEDIELTIDQRITALYQAGYTTAERLHQRIIRAIMKAEVAGKMAVTLEELKAAILQSWRNISLETIRACINSMPNRLQDVIASNGREVNY